MPDKQFTVRNTKGSITLLVIGKNLAKALIKEGLDPSLWREIEPPKEINQPPEKE